MTRLKFSSKRTIWNIWYLEQKQIIDSFAHNIWKIATPPTAMDDDGLPAESATTISRLVLILLFTNTQYLYFYLKSNKNVMSMRKTRTFQQMVVNTMQLLTFCYSCKYTDWSINSIKWKTVFSDALSSLTIRKWGQFMKTPSQKLHKLLFLYVNGHVLASPKRNWFLKILICWPSILNA